MADRKDSDIIRRQLKDLADYEQALVKKQNEFQKLADNLGIEWRQEEARSRKQREETIAAVKKHLEKKLADALTREGKTGKTATRAGRRCVRRRRLDGSLTLAQGTIGDTAWLAATIALSERGTGTDGAQSQCGLRPDRCGRSMSRGVAGPEQADGRMPKQSPWRRPARLRAAGPPM